MKDYFLGKLFNTNIKDNPSAVTDINIGTKWEAMMKQATAS
jgi:hypothetical protein